MSLLAGSCLPGTTATASTSPAPVRFSVHLSKGSRLGGSAAIRVRMGVDVKQLRSPVTDVQIRTPRGLDVATSGLGLDTCTRPATEIASVFVPDGAAFACPRNSLLGSGTATATLLFPEGDGLRPIRGDADVELFSGAAAADRPGLALLVNTSNPLAAQLSYTGELFNAPRPFGLALRLKVPKIPRPLFGIELNLALSRMNVLIGGPEIVYRTTRRGRAVFYRPGGVVLPDRCARGGLPFQLVLRFLDGTERSTDATVRCPRSQAAG